MPGKTTMPYSYADSSEPVPSRSTFNVSENHKTTFDASALVPIYWDFLYPGEVRRGRTKMFVRLSNPLDFPLMDNLYITVHWFSVAIRNIWDNYRKFFGERENPGDSIDYTLPIFATGVTALNGDSLPQRLSDHLGLPHVAGFTPEDAHCLAHRAYYSIWNYWYRDSSIDDSLTLATDDGPDTLATDYALQFRRKRFDYFTGLLPQPQRGESVTIGGEVAIDQGGAGIIGVRSTTIDEIRRIDTAATHADVSGTNALEAELLYPNTTINELRNAVAIQQFLERDNRAGQLFGDLIRAHYGANFLDAKYAPSFIAGGREPMMFQALPNVSAESGPTGSEQALGELGAIGTGVFDGANFTYRCTEPEILMGIVSIDADLTYHQGLNRKFSYRTRYDFMYPEFQGIGDQAVLKKELYWSGGATDEDVLGYGPRYEECRVGINRLSREFRPDYATPLDTWHLAEDFASQPSLNSTFLQSTPPVNRVVKVSSVDNFIADIRCEQYSTKALSLRGVPGLGRL